MKKFLILLTVSILACAGLTQPVSAPTITPLSPPQVDSTPQASPIPETESATSQPANIPNASGFPAPSSFEWKPIVSGLDRPVDVQSPQDGTGRLFIIEKYGAIRTYQNGELSPELFLNIEDKVDDDSNEMGLLGLVFHPNFAQNNFFYVNYTGAGGHTYISRFTASQNTADPASEKLILKIEQPFPNHNGGGLAFGPDGYLYAGLGDGGLAGDPYQNGQNTSVLLGKILRLDVDSGDSYSIPADNPFGNEVWAYGLRNPWRISFDQVTGDLWIGDVGQGDWEEIDYLPAGSAGGANFGWSIMEGSHSYDGAPQPDLLLPVTEYDHNLSDCSVTGGYVYRGAMPEWQGIYLYGDYCTGTVRGLILLDGQWQAQVLFETGLTITSFGQDASGELYLASDNGSIYQLFKK